MTEHALAQRFEPKEAAANTPESASHEASSRFLDEAFSFPLKFKGNEDIYKPKEEYKNGMASEDFMKVEKWYSDEKQCGVVNQDKLLEKLSDFAKKADDMWQKIEDGNDMDLKARMGEDTLTTYSRFGKLFDQLDEQHRNKMLETIPWRLRPGE